MPGPVSNVTTSRVSDEVVLINWSAPEVVNGILQRYILVYREYDSSSTAEAELNVSLPDTSLEINGLCELIASLIANNYIPIYMHACTVHYLQL